MTDAASMNSPQRWRRRYVDILLKLLPGVLLLAVWQWASGRLIRDI